VKQPDLPIISTHGRPTAIGAEIRVGVVVVHRMYKQMTRRDEVPGPQRRRP